MREAGVILYEVMNELKEMVKEGTSALELDKFAEEKNFFFLVQFLLLKDTEDIFFNMCFC